MATQVTGFDNVMRNLNAEIKAIKGRSMKGLIEGVAIIHRGTETQTPKVPVDTGNLRNSWFTTPGSFMGSPYVQFGYTANYAAFVHEMVGADFTSARPRYDKRTKKMKMYTPRKGAGAKFLETAITDNKEEILEVVRKNAYIKK